MPTEPNPTTGQPDGASRLSEAIAEVANAYDVDNDDAVAPPLVPSTKKPVAAAPAEPPPAKPDHSPSLLRAAEQFGVHPIIVERLTSEELMAYVLDQKLAARNDPLPQTPTQTGQAQAPKPGQVVTPETQALPGFDWGEHDEYDEYGRATGKKVKYTDDMINPALAAHIKRLDKQNQELLEFKKQVESSIRSNQERTVEQAFDAAFSEIPQVFGKGAGGELKGKPEFTRRAAVYNTVVQMRNSMPPELRGKASIRELVLMVAKTMFGDAATPEPEAPPQSNGRSAVSDRFAGAGVAVPTARAQADKPHGRSRAVEAVARRMSEYETNGEADDDDIVI